jgi:4-nitrophenyl phosphatase/NagD protein
MENINAQMIKKLKSIKAFILDMDGTVFLSDQLLPGAKELVDFFKRQQIPFLLLTNNSSRQGLQYVQKLGRLGLDVAEKHIFTSGEATAIYLQEYYQSVRRIYLVGTPALEQEFVRQGFELSDQDPQAVVLGFDTTLTYEKLWKLCDFIRAGLPYIATHPDINCPISGGFMPDIGAMMAFVKVSTGKAPHQIVGKPNAPVVSALMKKLNFPASEICMVGDRLYTDIALGQAGLMTVLVLSGETRLEMVPDSPFQPDLVVENLAALYQILHS